MIRLWKYTMLYAFAILLLQGCYYDKEDELYPAVICDTSDVTFSGTIKPLLNDLCLNCHSNTTAPSLGANIRLENFADVKVYALDSSLFGSMSRNPQFVPMPKDQKPDECIIAKVRVWVNANAPNN